MSELRIDIQVGNTVLSDTVIPGDYLIEHIISELVDELNLPRLTEDGRLMEYVLFWVNGDRVLQHDASLLVSGVKNGDTLHLVSSYVEPNATGIQRFAPVEIPSGFIDVILVILDINKTERVALELDREIGDILDRIVQTYNLPTRGKFNELATYHLTSKAMGARLNRSKTLRQEGVPPLDRLSMSREEVAGGRGMRLRVDVGASGMFVETVTAEESKVNHVIHDLVTRLGLERVSNDGALIRYSLLHGSDLSTLPERKSLHKAGVRDGDTIRLVSDHQTADHRTKWSNKFRKLKSGGWLKSRRNPAATLRAGPRSPSDQSDHVKCTVFAPPTIRRGGFCLVQVFTHLLAHADEAKAAAEEFDSDTERRGSKSLGINIEPGATLTFHLLAPEFEVDGPVQELVWSGSPESVQFKLRAAKDQWLGDFVATLRVIYETIPLGHIKFKIEVVDPEQLIDKSGPTGEAYIYRKAFVSYASADRAEVLKRVQMLARLRIDFFSDILDLEPGERWEQTLYRHIDDSDLFLLFWSMAAKNSQWVMKEVRYAMWLKKGDDQAPPEIIPIIIEGPPFVPPPDDLAHLHFNDQILYFISGSDSSASESPGRR